MNDEVRAELDEHQTIVTEAEHKASDLQRANNRLRREITKLRAEGRNLRDTLAMVQHVADTIPDPPEWLAPEPNGHHVGTPILFLSDTHFDEVVNPAEILGLNAYNRDIAELRLRRAFEGAVTLPERYLGTNLTMDQGIVMIHGGDLITGEIHDELTDTNEATPPDTIIFYLDAMCAGIDLLKREYGKVHIVEVDGNHDRRHKRKKAKRRVRDSWSWMFWKIVARHYANDDDVTIQVPESLSTIFRVHDTRFYLHHGDMQRGGGGIAGPLTPISIGHYRTSRQHADAVRYTGRGELDFDIMLQGHIHHRISIPGVISAGALKGYDEYAHAAKFPFEPASQELLIVTPERGVTFQAPIYVADPVAEGWS